MENNNVTFWNEQATSMMRQWMHAQEQALTAWSAMAKSVSTSTQSLSNNQQQWQQQWQQWQQWQQQMLKQTQVAAGFSGAAQDLFRRTLAGQTNWMRLVQQMADAWKVLAPAVEAGGNWQAMLEQYTSQLQEQLTREIKDAAATVGKVQSVGREYLELMQKIGQPWVNALLQLSKASHNGDLHASTPFRILSDSMYEAYQQSVGGQLEGPGLGLMREFNEQMVQGSAALQTYQRANVAYRSVVAAIWGRAFQHAMRMLVERARKGEPVDSLRDLSELWTQVADDVFIEAFSSDEYLVVQRDLLESSLSLRVHVRELIEVYQRMVDLPTRSEVDEAFETLYKVRKQVKTLSKTRRTRDREVETLREEMQALRQELEAMRDLREEVQVQRRALASVLEDRPASEAEAAQTSAAEEQPDHESWTRSELYDRAQELDISGRSGMNKEELVEAVRAHDEAHAS